MCEVALKVTSFFVVEIKFKEDFHMEIKKITQTKSFKGGYSAEQAMEYFNVGNVEELDELVFNILNIQPVTKDEKEYLRIYVHNAEINPFSVKMERTKALETAIEKIEIYGALKFKGLETCRIKQANSPATYYHKASEMVVL